MFTTSNLTANIVSTLTFRPHTTLHACLSIVDIICNPFMQTTKHVVAETSYKDIFGHFTFSSGFYYYSYYYTEICGDDTTNHSISLAWIA